MTALVEVEVCTPDGATSVAVLTGKANAKAQDELNGVGAGSFDVHLDDPQLGSVPAILDPFNVVKLRPLTEPAATFAFQTETLAPTQVASDEAAGRWVTVSGRQVRSILDTAVVTGSGDQRTFDFSSPDLPGYPAGWDVPVGVAKSADTTARANNPADWPNDDAAMWLWSTSPVASAPAERNWFRTSFTLAVPTDVTIWATADNSMSLRLNGVQVIATDPTERYAWRSTYKHSATLPAGTHVVAAWVDNAASTALNPGGFLCTIGTADTQGALATVLRHTDTTNWKVHAAANPPGWTAAEILIAVLTEAQADGYLPGVSWDFTGDVDSDGVPWDDVQDVQISVATDLLSVSNLWAGTVYDIHMTPELVLQAFKSRGEDLTATVAFTAGVDVMALAPTANFGQLRNVAVTRHPDGWLEVTDPTSTALYGKRATGLSLGDAGTADQAEQTAVAALRDLAEPVITLPLASTSVAGPQPFADFNLGDVITAPAFLAGDGPALVVAVTMSEQAERIQWNTDLYPTSMTDFEPADFEFADFT